MSVEENEVEKPSISQPQRKKVKLGDFVLLDYSCLIKDSGELYYTTNSEIAKKFNVYDKSRKYAPQLVIIGAKEVPRGLEEELLKMEEGEEKEIELPPEKGFGKRDERKVRVLLIKRFREPPKPGDIVVVNNERGRVLSVSSGRVRVDFNHPLAGKNLLYKVKITKIVRDPIERAKLLLERAFPNISMDRFNIRSEENTLYVELPPDAFSRESLFLEKNVYVNMIGKYVKKFKKVVFMEPFVVASAST